MTKPSPLKNWGGVRTLQGKLKRSDTLTANREAVAYELLSMASTRLTDIVEWDDKGSVKVKSVEDIPKAALSALKSIKVNTKGELEVELYDKVGVLRILAKASGLLDRPEDEDKPAVIGINVKAPNDT
jgi:hypothetical protein